MTQIIDPGLLVLAPLAQAWLAQFDTSDQELARQLLHSLTLVSHSEFERSLRRLIETEGAKYGGPVALYAVREWDPSEPYFKDASFTIDAVGAGSDLGSEARVAALIRSIAKQDPSKYLNHPTIEQMRAERCRAVLLVDDIIGSGDRCFDFYSGMWLSETLRSWHSLKLITISALAYSGTTRGTARVRGARGVPAVRMVRSCPTFPEMPWLAATRKKISGLIRRYGVRTVNGKSPEGYDGTAAALVFEHGCPDNCPAILWAEGGSSPWTPLFPSRTIAGPLQSCFPPEVARRDPVLVMIQAGQEQLVRSGSLNSPGPLGPQILVILALVGRGIRGRAALAHATGFTADASTALMAKCVQLGLLTTNFHLTDMGAAELNLARRSGTAQQPIPVRGEEGYYPKQLRRPVNG